MLTEILVRAIRDIDNEGKNQGTTTIQTELHYWLVGQESRNNEAKDM